MRVGSFSVSRLQKCSQMGNFQLITDRSCRDMSILQVIFIRLFCFVAFFKAFKSVLYHTYAMRLAIRWAVVWNIYGEIDPISTIKRQISGAHLFVYASIGRFFKWCRHLSEFYGWEHFHTKRSCPIRPKLSNSLSIASDYRKSLLRWIYFLMTRLLFVYRGIRPQTY